MTDIEIAQASKMLPIEEVDVYKRQERGGTLIWVLD